MFPPVLLRLFSGGAAAAGSASSAGGDALDRVSSSRRLNCSIGPRCGNRCLQERASPPLTLVPTPGKGWGVIAGADIPAGSFIVEYVGEIVDEAVSEFECLSNLAPWR